MLNPILYGKDANVSVFLCGKPNLRKLGGSE